MQIRMQLTYSIADRRTITGNTNIIIGRAITPLAIGDKIAESRLRWPRVMYGSLGVNT